MMTALIRLAAGLLVLLTPPASRSTRDQEEARHSGYSERVVWQRADAADAAEGLFLLAADNRGMVSRLLVETPGGNRIILTKAIDAINGLERVSWRDDETGWWLEVTKNLGFQSSDLHEFFATVHDQLRADAGKMIGVRLRTRGSIDLTRDVRVGDQTETHAAIVDVLRREGLADKLAVEVPTRMTEAVRFLDSAIQVPGIVGPGEDTPHGYDMRSVVDVLAAVIPKRRTAVSYDGNRWTERTEDRQRGLVISTDTAVKFTKRFRAIAKPEEPLADSRLADVFPLDLRSATTSQ